MDREAGGAKALYRDALLCFSELWGRRVSLGLAVLDTVVVLFGFLSIFRSGYTGLQGQNINENKKGVNSLTENAFLTNLTLSIYTWQ